VLLRTWADFAENVVSDFSKLAKPEFGLWLTGRLVSGKMRRSTI
jgi:hypothetical protein